MSRHVSMFSETTVKPSFGWVRIVWRQIMVSSHQNCVTSSES